MGEAAKRLSPEFCTRHPQIPWRLLAGMRDRLIHAYHAVDMEEVWNVLERDVPDLPKKGVPLVPPGEE